MRWRKRKSYASGIARLTSLKGKILFLQTFPWAIKMQWKEGSQEGDRTRKGYKAGIKLPYPVSPCSMHTFFWWCSHTTPHGLYDPLVYRLAHPCTVPLSTFQVAARRAVPCHGQGLPGCLLWQVLPVSLAGRGILKSLQASCWEHTLFWWGSTSISGWLICRQDPIKTRCLESVI